MYKMADEEDMKYGIIYSYNHVAVNDGMLIFNLFSTKIIFNIYFVKYNLFKLHVLLYPPSYNWTINVCIVQNTHK